MEQTFFLTFYNNVLNTDLSSRRMANKKKSPDTNFKTKSEFIYRHSIPVPIRHFDGKAKKNNTFVSCWPTDPNFWCRP